MDLRDAKEQQGIECEYDILDPEEIHPEDHIWFPGIICLPVTSQELDRFSVYKDSQREHIREKLVEFVAERGSALYEEAAEIKQEIIQEIEVKRKEGELSTLEETVLTEISQSRTLVTSYPCTIRITEFSYAIIAAYILQSPEGPHNIEIIRYYPPEIMTLPKFARIEILSILGKPWDTVEVLSSQSMHEIYDHKKQQIKNQKHFTIPEHKGQHQANIQFLRRRLEPYSPLKAVAVAISAPCIAYAWTLVAPAIGINAEPIETNQ